MMMSKNLCGLFVCVFVGKKKTLDFYNKMAKKPLTTILCVCDTKKNNTTNTKKMVQKKKKTTTTRP